MSKGFKLFLGILAFIYSVIVVAVEPFENADPLVLAADPWCPFNCVPGSEQEGIMVDLAREALKSKNIKVVYVSRPWQRALKEVKQGVVGGVIGAGISDGKGLILPNTPYGMSIQAVAVRKADTFVWNGANSIGDRRLAKILGYGYGGVLDEFIADHRGTNRVINNTGENALRKSIRMVAKDLADITIDEVNVLRTTAKALGVMDELRYIKTGRHNKLFIALSPEKARSAQIAQWLDEGMTDIKANGKYHEILKKYNFEPW